MRNTAVFLWLALTLGLSSCFAKAAAPQKQAIIHITENGGIDDKSFNAAAWRGITNFFGDTPEQPSLIGKSYSYLVSQTQEEQASNIKLAVDERPKLISAAGFIFSDEIKAAALAAPEQDFLLIDAEAVMPPNVKTAVFAEEEGSYLVGAVAALKAKEDGIQNAKFGFLGGVPGPLMSRFERGFALGVQSVLPQAQVISYYANDWARPDLGKTQAKNWFDSNVYAIYAAAGPTGSGVIAQAKEYRSQGKNVWAIGVDSDQHDEGIYMEGQPSAVLTSMIKHVELPVIEALAEIAGETFKGGSTFYSLQNGGIEFSTKNQALSRNLINEAQDIKMRLINGQLEPPLESAGARAR